ncbi:PAS domain-containing protein [Nodosilinea sp. PGN35]|uniref:PAS domain-containing protein n=1 Tax=Nodosilinea sp. PGN35 TaxID=3020489 RepID=UPI0023B33165|nr:PAS domain-containing protein [Nodosilinea sp. TSF1-S3]MDF0366750.1 PAS domain-containing protein [Nodosilinea sp. TSF1-S3]
MAKLQAQTQIAAAAPSLQGPQRCAADRPTLVLLKDSPGPTAPPDYQLLAATSLDEALKLWQSGISDWAVVDLEASGLAFLATLGKTCTQRPLPVVVLVGPGEERAALEAMKLGAVDYLFRAELSPSALWARVHGCRQTYQQTQTTQQQTAVTLEQARQHYQNLVENSPDIVERFDRELRHLYVSPALAEITGIDTAAFLGKTCRELGLDTAMVDRWEAAAAVVLATGKRQAIEFTTPTLVGLRHFEMVLAPEWSELGQVESLLCISRDISDRVAAQQAQQQLLTEAQTAQHSATAARDSLARVFDRINDGIIAFDRDSRCVYLNPSAEKTLGRSALAIVGKQIWNEFPEAVGSPIYGVYHRAVEQQQPEFLEYFYPPLGWFEVRLYPDTEGITAYFTDISDRKTAAAQHQQTKQLRHELTLLEQIVDSVLAGYWDFDFQRQTAYYSPRLKAILGYAEDELPNRLDTWQQLAFPDDIPKALASLDRHVQSQGEVLHYVEVRYRHKNGGTVWVLCAGQVIEWNEAGQPLRMVGCHVDITPLKQAEAQLKTHQAHLQAAQRIGNLGSWEFELATGQITWSDQVYRIFGLETDAHPASFETLQGYFHPDDRDRHRQTVETILATRQPYDEEFCIVRADGSLGYIHVKGEAVVDGAHLTHLTGTVQDISDRKRTETERSAQEDQVQNLSLRLSLALESAHIGTWERDMATDAVIWDQCLIDLYGFAQLGRQANYWDWRQQVYAEDIQRVETAHQALVDHGIPYDLEFRIWRGDGTLGWIRSSSQVRRNAQGHPLSIVGINYDITDQKQAEAQLRDLSLRLDLALESGGIGTFELDLVTLEGLWDQRMYAIYGLPEIGQGLSLAAWRNYVHGDDAERVDSVFGQVLEGGSPPTIEFRIRRGDGELRWVRATALVQSNGQGRPLRMIGTNSDITAAKRAEEQLLHATAQLATSNRELEAFAYSVSHDLRAPLRAIDGFSRALIEDYGDQFGDEGRDYFDRIRHNVGRMGQLIDDLLRLSRVSRQAMAAATVNLSALVQEQIDELRDEQPERTVAVAIAPDLTITADPTLMRVAIANLVHNAWKFTAHCPCARLEFGAVVQGGEPVYHLRDNGAGFDMAYAHKLFGVFQRLHNTDEFPGTGIGLATVQRAIHRQGGRVWAEAAVGQGATFYFTLPRPAPTSEGRP